VLAIVEACTDADIKPKPPWRARKEAYIAAIAHKDASALLVGAADKLHNANAILSDLRPIGAAVFDRFTLMLEETERCGITVSWRQRLPLARHRWPIGEQSLAVELRRVVETLLSEASAV
jgi:hypothetical protein